MGQARRPAPSHVRRLVTITFLFLACRGTYILRTYFVCMHSMCVHTCIVLFILRISAVPSSPSGEARAAY